jgi:hypothetical protein
VPDQYFIPATSSLFGSRLLAEGLKRAFPADTRNDFDDLLRLIDVADSKRQTTARS